MPMGRDPDWQRVARMVRDRRESIGITQDAPGGPSKATWYKIENAIDPPYAQRTIRAICRVLGWSDDSIQRIGRGEQPVVVGKASSMWGADQALEDRVAELEAKVEALKTVIAAGGGEVVPLEPPLTPEEFERRVKEAAARIWALDLPQDWKAALVAALPQAAEQAPENQAAG